MNAHLKTRIWYSCGIVLLIAFGLLSRKISVIPPCVGDALWAMVMYCCWRILLIRKAAVLSAIIALTASFLIELSQLLRWQWLVDLRATTLGHLLLGQGFLWSDLLAYTVGIGILFLLTEGIGWLFKKRQKAVVTKK
ncbi:MAG: DUF2809 domain-containing protein [Clostridia bacterium]|nr:DUF2809 domain-containing protein [Clostridia bacterium]